MQRRERREAKCHRQPIQVREVVLMRDQVPGPALGELDRSVDATDVNHRAGECDAGEQELSVTQVRWGRLVSLCRSESVFLFGPLALLLGLGGRESGWWVRRYYSPTMAVRVRPVCNDAENKIEGEDGENCHCAELEEDTGEHWRGVSRAG